MSLRLASMSLRSMRLASDTSSSAVRSGTLPISLRYMRTGSLVGVLTERSSLTGTSSSGLASGGPSGSAPSPSMMSMPRSAKRL